MNAKIQGLVVLLLSVFLFSSCTDDPSAGFTPSSSSVDVGEVVTFEDESSNGNKYYWDFGDGNQETFATATNPTHRYSSAGTYTVTQVVKNDAGSSEQTQTIEVGSVEAEEQKLQIMNGVWDLDEYEETNFEDNSQVNQTRVTYQSTTVEFISSNEYLRNDDDGNESTGFWELLKKDRVEWQSEVYVINTLTEDEMVLRRVEKSTFGTQNTRDIYEYKFSR